MAVLPCQKKQLAGFILHNSAVFLDEVNNLPRVNLRVSLSPLPSASSSTRWEANPINQPHGNIHCMWLNCSVLPLGEYAPALLT